MQQKMARIDQWWKSSNRQQVVATMAAAIVNAATKAATETEGRKTATISCQEQKQQQSRLGQKRTVTAAGRDRTGHRNKQINQQWWQQHQQATAIAVALAVALAVACNQNCCNAAK